MSGWDRWTVDLGNLPPLYYVVESSLGGGGVVHRSRSCGFLYGRPSVLTGPYLSHSRNWRWCSVCGGVRA